MTEWLDIYPNQYLFTNREIIANPEYAPDGWFNALTEPEKLEKERGHFKTARDWREYVKENYPHLDPKAEYKLKAYDNKIQAVKDCGKPITVFDAEEGIFKEVKRLCKHYDLCKTCPQIKIDKEFNRLSEYIDIAQIVDFENEKEAKNFIRSHKKYRRLLSEGGRVRIVVITDEKVGKKMTFDDVRELSRLTIPIEGHRPSGSLGKPVAPVKEEQQENEVVYHYREMRIEYNGKDGPQNVRELQIMSQNELVLILTETPQTEEQLQWAIYTFEEKARSICQQYEMSFNFLVRKTKYINIKEVEWKWLKKKKP